MQVFAVLSIYAIDFYSFFLASGAFNTMYFVYLSLVYLQVCVCFFLLKLFPVIKASQSLKNGTGNGLFSLVLFSPGLFGIGQRVRGSTFQTKFPVQISPVTKFD